MFKAPIPVEIRSDDLSDSRVHVLLERHLQLMYEITPAQSVHAFDVEQLRGPDISFWSAWQGDQVVGCAALKRLDEQHAEIKSMHTLAEHRGQGIGARLLESILDTARRQRFRRLSLETGVMAEFAPARCMYAKYGFEPCQPFADYIDDPNSFFMTLVLDK